MGSKSLIKIDQSTKLVLDYVEKVRGVTEKKRQRLEEKINAVRPADFPGIDLQKLCDILIRFAYNGTYIDETFRDHLCGLVIDESLSWNQVLHSIITTKIDQVFMKCQLCDLVRQMIPHVQIKAFDDPKHADTLISVILPTFNFVSQLLIDVLSDEEDIETMIIEYECTIKPYQLPLEALDALIRDDLCQSLLVLHNANHVAERLQECLDAFGELQNPDKTGTSLMEEILEQHKKNCVIPKFEYISEGLSLFDFKNPSIRILVPIFACFKNHESSEHIANTIQTFAEIMRVPHDDVIFDLLHAAILLKCEESMDLLHLPKQRRVDFRWQSTAFFYRKLPQIIGYLIKSEKIKPDDVKKGMDRALDDLTMMFDSADSAWQNASFLTLLNDLEPLLGKENTEVLRNKRRDHMKSVSHLSALADSATDVIENTDISKLLAAVKDVKQLQFGENEDFWKTFSEKVHEGECDDFDAITSILTAEGKLMETGKVFAMKNKDAQEEEGDVMERIREFDETFLLMSRIVIKNPSLSIRLFVNGGPEKSEAERTIFLNWSMWYVKRVAKHPKPEAKDEEEMESLRQEVEMLARVATVDVGIEESAQDVMENEENEDEEEEEIVETREKTAEPEEPKEPEHEPEPEPEPVKDEEMPQEKEETKEAEPEKMDTSEPVETADAPESDEAAAEKGTEEPAKEGDKSPNKEEEPAEASTSDAEKEVKEEPVEEPKEAEEAKEAKEQEEPQKSPEQSAEEEKPREASEPLDDDRHRRRKKKEILVTWHSLNCPLPRITRKNAKVYLARLKEGFPFWETDDPVLNLGSLIGAVPQIGQLLLEDHEEKRHRIDRKAAEESMKNILHALRDMSCLFVCFVEWMDCQPDTRPRTSLAITMQAALEKAATATDDPYHKKWQFVQSTLDQIFHEMVDKSPAFPEVTCTAFSTARRFCPYVTRNEEPDQVKLKHAWYYMRQQGWASPHALRLLEHANIAGDYNIWSHIYINKAIKSGCGDIMKTSVDMIFSFLMLDDLNSIIRMHESLIEFWLNEDASTCTIDGRFDPLAMKAVIRLMTQLMLVAEWTLDRLRQEEELSGKKTELVEPIEAPEHEDPDMRAKWIFLLEALMERTVNRFLRHLRKGMLSTVVNVIIQLIKSIAGSADCKAKHLLIRRIPPKLIFQLAYIEPTSVDYSLMNVFCDPENKEHTQTKIMFLCALRKATSR